MHGMSQRSLKCIVGVGKMHGMSQRSLKYIVGVGKMHGMSQRSLKYIVGVGKMHGMSQRDFKVHSRSWKNAWDESKEERLRSRNLCLILLTIETNSSTTRLLIQWLIHHFICVFIFSKE